MVDEFEIAEGTNSFDDFDGISEGRKPNDPRYSRTQKLRVNVDDIRKNQDDDEFALSPQRID